MADLFVRNAGGPTADQNMVSADQTTIIGNGTSTDPLRAGPSSGGGTFEAACRSEDPFPGMPAFISFLSESGGITTVQVTDVRAEDAGVAAEFKAVAGVVERVNESGTVQVQASGLLTLSIGEWDFAAESSGGLVMGKAYYPSATTTGKITTVPPSGPGQYVTRFGTAMSATTMLIQPQTPVQNLADFIFFAASVQQLILGMAVYIDGASGLATPADQNINVDRATAVGLVCAFDVNDDPIIQLGGIVVLTDDEWDLVASGGIDPGLKTGSAYYVDTNAASGHITTEAPTEFAKVQVGIALTSTQLVLPGPFLERLT